MTAKDILKLALRKVRHFFAVRKLARIERDLDLCRAQRDAIHAAEAWLQRESMILRADLKKRIGA